ncbi:MAG: head GIN domain-containing protein [Armatimonadota bacterium]
MIWVAIILYVVILGAIVGALGWAATYRKGSGHVVTEVRSVSGFDRVAVSGPGTLVLVRGNGESLSVEAEDNVLPEIETKVEDGRLEIGFRRWWPRGIRPTKSIRYQLTARSISAVSTSGSVAVKGGELRGEEVSVSTSGSSEVDLEVEAKSLQAAISGSGTFRLKGSVDDQSTRISGSGTYLARDLQSKRASVRVSGSGRAEVAASQELSVVISGSGDVAYWGDPVVTRSVSGSGDVHRAGP